MASDQDQSDQFTAQASDKREQSTIVFPYLDLDAAVEVARAIYNRSGLGECGLDELAAEMKQTMSGAFRLKTGTAKIFDLVDKDGKSTIRLSDLGRQIVSQDNERAARVEAFLRVPLYQAVFDKYKGHLLPPPKALEREMQGLGVSSKQKDKARQAFERSARQAYFFESGEDRLVRPRTELPTRKVDEPDEQANEPAVENVGSSSGARTPAAAIVPAYHPFVQGLLDELPQSEKFADWSIEDQAEWLIAAAGIFKLLSKSKGRITINVAPQNAAATSQ